MILFNPYAELVSECLAALDEPTLLRVRKKLIWAYSWAIPSQEAVSRLASRGPWVELGAGTGYWAWLIEQARGKVTALDVEPGQPPWWKPVQRGDDRSLAHLDADALLLVWPPYQTPMAERALDSFTGTNLAYVGEWRGRTATDAFHDRLEREFTLEEEIAIPCWPGYRDRLYLFRRNA